MSKTIHSREMAMMGQLHEIAAAHAETSHDSLVLLDLDPDAHPGQRMNQSVIEAGENQPLDPVILSSVVNDIDPRFPALEQRIDTMHDEGSVGLLAVIQALKNRDNVINGSDHAELLDIAFSHLAFTGIVRRSGVGVRSAFVASKMIDFLGVEMHGEVSRARDLLQMGFDLTYLTIPSTLSTAGKFNLDDMTGYNRKIRRRVASDMRRDTQRNKRHDPIFMGAAIPGTLNKRQRDNPNGARVVGKVSDGILTFTGIAHTGVVATASRLHSATNADMFVDDLVMSIDEPPDIVNFMDRLLVGMTKLDGQDYIYDQEGNIPVITPS